MSYSIIIQAHNHDPARHVIKIFKSTVQSLCSEMPLHTHSESMFGGYCVKTTTRKAFIFLYKKGEMLGEKQRQASNKSTSYERCEKARTPKLLVTYYHYTQIQELK